MELPTPATSVLATTLHGVNKRYQVFVSSTYTDLKDERAEVIQMLLSLDALPAGMELFPATNDDAWTLIKRVIDESDYYVLVVGGRYGSVDADAELSYTEMEFDYAVGSGKPVMAFVHGEPGSIPTGKTDQSDFGSEKLAKFRAKVLGAVHVKHWTRAAELGGLVAASFSQIQKSHPAIGWVRGDVQTSTESLEEINALRKRLEAAEQQIADARTGPPPGTEAFAQDEDTVEFEVRLQGTVETEVEYHYGYAVAVPIVATWNRIFATIAPALFDEASQPTLKKKLDRWFYAEAFPAAQTTAESTFASEGFMSFRPGETVLTAHDFDTVVVQLSTLGLIARSDRKRSVKDTGTYWTLTPYGHEKLTSLRAIKRG